MTTEVVLGYTWMYNTLTADTTLQGYASGGVWYIFALPGTPPPYILIKYHSGNDYMAFGGVRAYSDMRFQAIAVGPVRDLTAIWNAATRIDQLLTVTSQTVVTDGTILASFRDQPVSIDEWVDGEKWNSTGGEYRILAKAS